LDEISENAKKIGAVNTILNKNGVLFGENTDIPGFEKSAKYFLENSKSALILGAGGVARAFAIVLKKYGIETFVKNRNSERQKKFVEEFSLKNYKNEKVDFIINATSLGLKKGEIPEIPENLSPKFVFDAVYSEEKTLFLSFFERKGAEIKDGKEMLIKQAKASFEYWFFDKF
jgi:shikimate dehydrogenase